MFLLMTAGVCGGVGVFGLSMDKSEGGGYNEWLAVLLLWAVDRVDSRLNEDANASASVFFSCTGENGM